MKGGKADKGGAKRGKKPDTRLTPAEKSRAGPKRGEKPRDWGAFETTDTPSVKAPQKGANTRQK